MKNSDRRLRILFLSNRGPLPIKDGQTRRTYNILKGLAKEHEIYLLSLYEAPAEIEDDSLEDLKGFCDNVEFFPSPTKKVSVPMLTRLVRSIFSQDPYTLWRHYSKRYCCRVDDLVRNGNFDLIHCDILPLVYLIRNHRTIFRSVTDHDVSYLKCLRMASDSSNPLFKVFSYIEAYKLKKLESTIFDQVNLGIAVSELDKDILQGMNPVARLEVIENGVDTSAFKPDPEKVEPDTLLWVGGFKHYPNKQGIHYFLNSIYPMIKEKVPSARLDVVGGQVTERLNRLASVDSSIRILGYVEDPAPYYQKASAFVVPIESGGGTRLKVLEAMGASKAIISTSIGCEGIEGKNMEHFLIADRPDEFAEATVMVLKDAGLRIRLGENARRLAIEKYDWNVIIAKLNQLYIKLVENQAQKMAYM